VSPISLSPPTSGAFTDRDDRRQLPDGPQRPPTSRLWREWCFCRVLIRRFWVRGLIMVAVLLGGGLLFKNLEPQKNLSLLEATYYTWSLVFGEPPESFPANPVLRALFFVIPVLGLTVIIEGIVELTVIVGNRGHGPVTPDWTIPGAARECYQNSRR